MHSTPCSLARLGAMEALVEGLVEEDIDAAAPGVAEEGLNGVDGGEKLETNSVCSLRL